ncbi:MAG: hypothetical protein AAB453_00580 [Patescibacteria group bacterium]
MKKIIWAIIFVVILIAGVWWYVGRDERAIKKTIREVASYASSEAGKSDIAIAVASQNLAQRFTEDAQIKWRWPDWPKIKTGEETLVGRDKIRESALVAKRTGNVKFEVTELKAETGPRAGEGSATATILVHFTDTGDLATFQTTFNLTKTSRWQIKSVNALSFT